MADDIEGIINSEDFDKIRRSAGVYSRNELNNYTQFGRFGSMDPYSCLEQTREYIFFTKPDLNLFKSGNPAYLNPEIENIPFFSEAMKRDVRVLKQLQITSNGNPSPFMNLLTNNVKSELELPAISTEIDNSAATVYGTSIAYPHSTIESDQNFDFSLEFEDSKYLEVYMLFRIWEEYRRKKDVISPPNDSYVINKILHDQVAVYKFIVGETGENIIHYSKLYGVFPKTVPRDIFGNLNSASGLKVNIDFHATFVEDMDPLILSDFNTLVQGFLPAGDDISLYDYDNNIVNGDWVTMPYIVYDSNNSLDPIHWYKLKWR